MQCDSAKIRRGRPKISYARRRVTGHRRVSGTRSPADLVACMLGFAQPQPGGHGSKATDATPQGEAWPAILISRLELRLRHSLRGAPAGRPADHRTRVRYSRRELLPCSLAGLRYAICLFCAFSTAVLDRSLWARTQILCRRAVLRRTARSRKCSGWVVGRDADRMAPDAASHRDCKRVPLAKAWLCLCQPCSVYWTRFGPYRT